MSNNTATVADNTVSSSEPLTVEASVGETTGKPNVGIDLRVSQVRPAPTTLKQRVRKDAHDAGVIAVGTLAGIGLAAGIKFLGSTLADWLVGDDGGVAE